MSAAVFSSRNIHLSQFIHLNILRHSRSSSGEGVVAHQVHGGGHIEQVRFVGKAHDYMAGDDGAYDHGNHGPVTELEVSKERDENSLADQVDNPTDAAVVAVLHHASTISSSHVVEADDKLAKEGEEDGQHDGGVVEEVEPLVVRSLLEAGVETVLDVVQAEGISSLMGPFLFLGFNPPRVPL